MADIAKLGIEVDSRQLRQGSQDLQSFSGQAQRTDRRVTSATRAIRNFASALAIGGTIRAVVGATIEQERVTAQLEQTLRSTGRYTPELSQNLQDYASALQNVSTFGDEAIIGSQALLLTFTQIGEEAFPRAQKAILDVATAMGMDLRSASLQLGKALNDPILGLTALQRSGIQFSESQKQIIKDMVEVGDVAGAQSMILDELETQFGGSALAARNTLGGALQSLKNAFGDLLEGETGVGGATDAINDLTSALNDPEVKAGFESVIGFIFRMGEGLIRLPQLLGFVRDEIQAWAFGPAADDIIRLEDHLASLQDRLETLSQQRSFRGTGQDVQIRAEIAETEALIEAAYAEAAARRATAQAAKEEQDAKEPNVPRLKAETEGSKELTEELERQAKARQKLFDAHQSSVEALQLEAVTMGMTRREAELYRLEMEGATRAQLESADAAMLAIEAFDARRDAERSQERVDNQVQAIIEQMMSEEEQIQLSYDRRRDMVLSATFETEQARTELLERLEAERAQRLEDLEDAGNRSISNLGIYAEQAARNMQDAFAQFLFDPFEGGLRGMADSFARIIQQMIAQAIAADLAAAIGLPGSGDGGNVSGIASAIGGLFGGSFEGGGFTGHGSRSGGVDGRGGFPAILHPNETVIDHSRPDKGGQNRGRVSMTQNIIVQGRPDNRTASQIANESARKQRVASARLGA